MKNLGLQTDPQDLGSVALGITGASVGQYAKVKTVDGSGKPLTWEAGTPSGGATQVYAVRHISGNITALPKSFSYAFISADHRVINCVLGTPSAVISDLAWTTSAGDVTFTGTLANLGSTTIDFDIVKVVTP